MDDLKYYTSIARALGPWSFGQAVVRRVRRLVRTEAAPREIVSDAAAARFPLDDGLQWAPALSALLPGAADRLRHEAITLLNGETDCFGQTVPIAFDRDPISKKIFALGSSAQIDLFVGGADPRGAWEIGRLTHLLTLARAHAADLVHGADVAFVEGVRAFAKACPTGRGVQWTCTEEVALRAVNLALGYGLLRETASGRAIKTQMHSLLDAHGRHIEANLEDGGAVLTNHYVGDLLGLLAIGTLFPALPRAHRWAEMSKRELSAQIVQQIRGDGGHFESSTGYHRLALELFLAAELICRSAGSSLGPEGFARLVAMITFARGYLKPGGRAPQVGDTDSCRALWLGSRHTLDHSYLPALGAVLFGDARLKIPDTDAPEELFWIAGADGVRRYRGLAPGDKMSSVCFPESGLAILRSGDDYVSFACTPNGQGGCGGHAHNDKLALEVVFDGRDCIVDPGSFVYARDPVLRDRFRATAAHSTVQVDGREQAEFVHGRLFALPEQAEARITTFETADEFDRVVGEHTAWRPIIHRREVTLHKRLGIIVVRDRLEADGRHLLESRWALADTKCRSRQATLTEVAAMSRVCGNAALAFDRAVEIGPAAAPIALLLFSTIPTASIHFDESWYAPGYAQRVSSTTIRRRAITNGPITLTMVLFPLRSKC